MHRILAKKLLFTMKLNYDNCYYCLKMYSKFVPLNDTNDYYSREFKFYKQLIAENFGVDKECADQLLRNNLHVMAIDRRKILKFCEICQERNVEIARNMRDLKFLEWTKDDLENRILLLREMGAQYINTAMLKTCASRAHVISFKAYTKIPSGESIADKLYSHLHSPPPGVPELGELNDYMTVKEYRKHCLSHYIKWRLKIPDGDDRLIDYMCSQLRYKSFARLRDSFDLLHDELGLSTEQIRSSKYLFHISSSDIRNIFEQAPTICGASTKQLLMDNPNLVRMRYENVVKVKGFLEEFGITSEQICKTPQILLIDADAVKEGLKIIKETPELSVLVNHPSLLQILLTKDGVQGRIGYLRYLSVRDATVNVLGKSTSDFDSFLRTGHNRLKASELVLMLNKYFERDPTNVEEKIKRHPLWRHADLTTIHNTLKYLLESFDVDDIYENLQLLFYSKDNVEYALTGLIEMNQQIDEFSRFTPSQLLSLCSYRIEKEFHFTGDGVWDKSKQFKVPRSPEELNQETEEWKQYQKKYPLNDVNIFLFINTNKIQRLP